MECPICGSKTATILKTKKINSKKNSRRELLLKCENCGQVYNESIIEEKPQTYRLVISEHEDSFKTSVELFPDQELNLFVNNLLHLILDQGIIRDYSKKRKSC